MSKSLLPSAPLERLIDSESGDVLLPLKRLRDRYLSAASRIDALIGTTAVDQTESILSEDDNGTEKV